MQQKPSPDKTIDNIMFLNLLLQSLSLLYSISCLSSIGNVLSVEGKSLVVELSCSETEFVLESVKRRVEEDCVSFS